MPLECKHCGHTQIVAVSSPIAALNLNQITWLCDKCHQHTTTTKEEAIHKQ